MNTFIALFLVICLIVGIGLPWAHRNGHVSSKSDNEDNYV